jgi:ribonuclease HI
MRKVIRCYSDGACKGNPGPGGWGTVMFIDKLKFMTCGGKKHTTNNEMEMTAMINALRICKRGADITIISDSKYTLQGIIKGGVKGSLEGSFTGSFTGWIGEWEPKGWRKKDGKEPANLELWKDIKRLCEEHFKAGSDLRFEWVEGHSGDEGNELADQLANKGVPL